MKPESLQATGAFKIRGAFSLMTTLEGDGGVVAHSSGNHAQAVARAAKVLGRRAVVVMPSDAPPLKRARTEADGAQVVTVSPDSDARVAKAAALAEACVKSAGQNVRVNAGMLEDEGEKKRILDDLASRRARACELCQEIEKACGS